MKSNQVSPIRWQAALILCLGLCLAPIGAQAQLFRKTPEKLDERLRKSAEYLDLIQAVAAKRIPPQVLSKAMGIVILHEFKLGLGVGGEAGGGIAMVKNKTTGQWSPPAFVASAEGSYGFQIGGQKSDTVLLLMDDKGMELLNGTMEIGVNLRATAGPLSEGGEANIDNISAPVLVYANVGGLYAGAAIKGGGIQPQNKANLMYYGVPMADVLFGNVPATPSGQVLIDKVKAYSGQ